MLILSVDDPFTPSYLFTSITRWGIIAHIDALAFDPPTAGSPIPELKYPVDPSPLTYPAAWVTPDAVNVPTFCETISIALAAALA